jgi:hypothetical protein
MSSPSPKILYCHCRYAQVIPAAVKDEVLRQLCDAGIDFEAVPDLCELSARRDPCLPRLASASPLRIAACFPRAVKWLFASAGAPLNPATTEVLNMRTETAETIAKCLSSSELKPNLPGNRPTPGSTGPNPPEHGSS